MPAYTVTETHVRESEDIRFNRLIKILFISMSLKLPADSIYRNARSLGHMANAYLDIKYFLEGSHEG